MMQRYNSSASEGENNTSIPLRSIKLTELAELLGVPASDIIVLLLRKGVVCTLNQTIPAALVADIARQHGRTVQPVEAEAGVAPVRPQQATEGAERPPVVVVMGHVDHGKTTLLDTIRKTRVAAREKGGITQHVGAYTVSTPHGNIVFIDTPGHEAFMKLRVRGSTVADIAILVVAVDDGVMPQTIEAIKHAQAVNLPIIVALNKIDRADHARIESVKRSLLQYNLIPEELGGNVIFAPISAKTGQGVEALLELIALQAHVMELKADSAGTVDGFIIEVGTQRGIGTVATVILHQGTVRVGDFLRTSTATCRVAAIIDAQGHRLPSVSPSIPARIAGFTGIPQAGDRFSAISSQDFYAHKQSPGTGSGQSRSIQGVAGQGTQSVPVILKADTYSSYEVLLHAVEKFNAEFKKSQSRVLQVIHAGIGDVSESDVALAAQAGAHIYAFHVKLDPSAHELLARAKNITVNQFDIIYRLFEALQAAAKGDVVVQRVITKIGQAVVRKIFTIKSIGTIAGCYVRDGKFVRDSSVIIWRNNKKIFEGTLKSLQSDRRVVKEVVAGHECAFVVEGFTDWAIDDLVDCMAEVSEAPPKK